MLGESHYYDVTVSGIEKRQEFSVDPLGMEEVNRVTHEGETISGITGVEGTEMEISFLRAGASTSTNAIAALSESVPWHR